MKKFLNDNFKYILIVVGSIIVYLFILDLMTPSNGMTKEDLKKIEQIDKDINLLIESQKKLDESINEYKKEIEKIDSLSAYISSKKEMNKPLSIAEGLKFAKQGFYDNDSTQYLLPNTFDGAFVGEYLKPLKNESSKRIILLWINGN
ncbi:MAG: hypothetical protein EBR41_05655 [Crocinitomicaceae bacterium]|nr:hypothetical protein [Crocinitomicaceae bacterium]